MGTQKYVKKVGRLFEKSLVVSFRDIDRIVCEKKESSYAKQVIHSLLKSEKILQLTKGYYTKYPEISLSVFCFTPSYLGLQSALSFHGLWEQETIPVIITPRPVRQGIRQCMGGNILVRRTQRKYMFGSTFENDYGYYLPYSDIEKTLIDFFVFREKLSPEVVEKFREKIDRSLLRKYLSHYPQRIRVKVENALQAKK